MQIEINPVKVTKVLNCKPIPHSPSLVDSTKWLSLLHISNRSKLYLKKYCQTNLQNHNTEKYKKQIIKVYKKYQTKQNGNTTQTHLEKWGEDRNEHSDQHRKSGKDKVKDSTYLQRGQQDTGENNEGVTGNQQGEKYRSKTNTHQGKGSAILLRFAASPEQNSGNNIPSFLEEYLLETKTHISLIMVGRTLNILTQLSFLAKIKITNGHDQETRCTNSLAHRLAPHWGGNAHTAPQ